MGKKSYFALFPNESNQWSSTLAVQYNHVGNFETNIDFHIESLGYRIQRNLLSLKLPQVIL